MAEIFVAPRYELVQDTMAEIFLSVFCTGLIKKENKIIEAENKELKVETYWHAVILGTNQMELRYSI